MKRYSVVGVAEKREATANIIEVVHDVNVFAENKDEARGIVIRYISEKFPQFLVSKIHVLEIVGTP